MNTKKEIAINIGINTTSAVAGGGITYLDNLIKYVSIYDKQNNYYIFSTNKPIVKQFESKYKNFTWIRYKFPSISPILRMFWEQFIFPIYLKKYNIHTLLCPANIAPLVSNTFSVVVVQNMAVFNDDFIRYENISQKFRLYLLRILTIFSIKKAKRIIFISKNAQKQICSKFNLENGKSVMIYHGRDQLFNLLPESMDISMLKDKHISKNYILYVSNIYQYKNFYELILAFLKIKDKISNDFQLIFAGISFDDLYYARLIELIAKNRCEDRIRFIGHVPNDQLPIFYTNTRLFVYPSTIENCPNILIEAMGCGAAIASSNIEPMPEICQKAALYFNPNDPDDIANNMLKVIRSEELQKDLSEKALERVKFFTWEKTAHETLAVLND